MQGMGTSTTIGRKTGSRYDSNLVPRAMNFHLSHKYETSWSGQIWCLMSGLTPPPLLPLVNKYSNSSEQNKRVFPPTISQDTDFIRPTVSPSVRVTGEWPQRRIVSSQLQSVRVALLDLATLNWHSVTLERRYCRLYKVKLTGKVLTVCLTDLMTKYTHQLNGNGKCKAVPVQDMRA